MDGKVLVISDTHLTTKFNPKKFELLRGLINSCDQVVINGDFYEGFVINFSKFVTSPWQQLFPILKQKKAIYLPGNHEKNLPDHGYEQFCDQVMEKYEFEQNGVTFHVFHGHGVDRTFDVRNPNFPRFISGVVSRSEKIVCAVFGRRYTKIYKYENQILKRWKLKNLPLNDWLICGHTHLAELDETARFANSGLFLSEKLASYLTIENGKIDLHYIDG